MAGRLTVETMSQLPVAQFGPGGEGAPVTYLFFGTHGLSEQPSVDVGERIVLKDLHMPVEYGTVYVAFGNPLASAQPGRRFTEGGADLNRMWKDAMLLDDTQRNSYEYHRARAIDAVVMNDPAVGIIGDFHTTSNPNAVPFAIAEPHAEDLAATFEVEYVTRGFDQHEPGGLDHGANKAGKRGLCLEAGWSGDEQSVRRIEQGIESLLIAAGHTDKPSVIRARRRVTVIGLYQTGQEFTFAQSFPDFEPVSVGTLIGHDGEAPVHVSDIPAVHKRIITEGLTEVRPMFLGGPNGKKPAGMEIGLVGVDGPTFAQQPPRRMLPPARS